MSLYEVQPAVSAHGSSGAAVLTFGQPVGAGSEIRVHALAGPGGCTITDNQGNVYVPAGSPVLVQGAGTEYDWECASAKGGPLTITIANGAIQTAYAHEFVETNAPMAIQNDALTSIAASLAVLVPIAQGMSKAQIFDAKHLG